MTHLYAVHIICARGGYLRNVKKHPADGKLPGKLGEKRAWTQ